MAGADEVIAAARRAAEEDPRSLVAPIPDAIEQRAPGEVEFELLDDSDFELTERFDPEGNPEETWVSCHVLRWRTDFLPPGTVREPDRSLEDALTWRVSQWEWIPAEPDDEADDEDYEPDGEWALRGYSPFETSVVAENLPEPLQAWVRRVTRDVVGWFGAVEDDAPAFAAAAVRLKRELDALP
jgi:hypothetical protein